MAWRLGSGAYVFPMLCSHQKFKVKPQSVYHIPISPAGSQCILEVWCTIIYWLNSKIFPRGIITSRPLHDNHVSFNATLTLPEPGIGHVGELRHADRCFCCAVPQSPKRPTSANKQVTSVAK